MVYGRQVKYGFFPGNVSGYEEKDSGFSSNIFYHRHEQEWYPLDTNIYLHTDPYTLICHTHIGANRNAYMHNYRP